MGEGPLVSVVMINHNGMPWLRESVTSVLQNDFENFELIVCDDASEDGSTGFLEFARREDKRVKPILLAERSRQAAARNRGIQAALGRYVALLDSDDRFLPETLSRQLETFEKLGRDNPGLSLMVSDAWIINAKGERKGRYLTRDWWGLEGTKKAPFWALPSTFFFRREGAPKLFENFPCADSHLFFHQTAKKNPVGFTGQPLVEYRLAGKSSSTEDASRLLWELRAVKLSLEQGRMDNPIPMEEVDPAPAKQVAAWIHGRNAKAAFVNGRYSEALAEFARSWLSDPQRAFSKLKDFAAGKLGALRN